MKIADAKVSVCVSDGIFVTVKIQTDEGVYDVVDATLNGRELSVASYGIFLNVAPPDSERRSKRPDCLPEKRMMPSPFSMRRA